MLGLQFDQILRKGPLVKGLIDKLTALYGIDATIYRASKIDIETGEVDDLMESYGLGRVTFSEANPKNEIIEIKLLIASESLTHLYNQSSGDLQVIISSPTAIMAGDQITVLIGDKKVTSFVKSSPETFYELYYRDRKSVV